MTISTDVMMGCLAYKKTWWNLETFPFVPNVGQQNFKALKTQSEETQW